MERDKSERTIKGKDINQLVKEGLKKLGAPATVVEKPVEKKEVKKEVKKVEKKEEPVEEDAGLFGDLF